MSDAGGSARLGARWLLGALLFYTLSTVIFTWPAVTTLDSAILGGPRDGPMFLWNTWWGPHALFELGRWPLSTEHLFHPEGASLALHTHTLLPALLTAPIQALFGLVPAYNVAVLATFVLAGLGAMLLAWEVTRSRPAALVAGAMFAFCHFRVSSVMFFNLIQSQWLALYLWALWRTWSRSSWSSAWAAAAFGVALAYSSHTLLVFAALVSAPFVVCGCVALRADRQRLARFVRLTGFVALAVAVAALPLLWAIRAELEAHGSYVTLEGDSAYGETTRLAELLFRSPLSGGTGDLLRQAGFLGYTVMACGLLGIWFARRRRALWFWALVAGGFLILALGPVLDLRGFPVATGSAPLRLPFRWLQDVPILRDLRVAHRFGIVGGLGLSVVAAMGISALAERARRRFGASPKAVAAGVTALVGLVLVDFAQLPFPRLFDLPDVAPALRRIADDPRDCSVLAFPAGRSGYPPFSYFQTVHEKPVYMEGEVARLSQHAQDRRDSSALLTALDDAFAGRRLSDDELAALAPIVRAEVAAARIGWVVLAWADVQVYMKRDIGPRPAGLRAMDRLIRATLPVKEVVFEAPLTAVAEWNELPRRKSRSCLFRVYELVLAE